LLDKKKEHPKEKSELHSRNKHRGRYNFQQLIASYKELAAFVNVNDYGDESIDFFDPDAVKALNKALLKYYYDISTWDIPANYLCPPIPGRADYIHYAADLLRDSQQTDVKKIPEGERIICLDIGVGANCVYPIIGNKEYGWSFIGTDIDPRAIKSANRIIQANPAIKGKIELREQSNPKNIFQEIIKKNECVDLTICNPPFHSSLAEAQAGTLRKLKNLKQKKVTTPVLNFGGKQNELWCEGGEERFIRDMIFQSRQFAGSCFWFTTLVSKQAHLKNVYATLKKVEATDVKTIGMGQGNKISRMVAWTFLTTGQQHEWMQRRWEKIPYETPGK
jgi:23S rRNA (adenine1618-N6)-methyltransferase